MTKKGIGEEEEEEEEGGKELTRCKTNKFKGRIYGLWTWTVLSVSNTHRYIYLHIYHVRQYLVALFRSLFGFCSYFRRLGLAVLCERRWQGAAFFDVNLQPIVQAHHFAVLLFPHEHVLEARRVVVHLFVGG